MVTRRAEIQADPGIVEWDGGMRLSGTPLWLDASRPVPLSFVSSALRFHRHQRIVTSSQTVELLAGRLGSSEALPTPWGRAFSVGELVLELIPAGHVVGSALLRVRRGDLTLVYAAGLRLGGSLVVEPCRAPRADVLVLDCPYDAPPYRFAPPRRVASEMAAWIRQILDHGETPVLLAHPLGMAQELCRFLGQEGLAARVHRQVTVWNRRVRRCGLPLDAVPELRGSVKPDEVVVAPPEGLGSGAFERQVPRARPALVSGRAASPEAVERAGAEVGFTWSCQADGKELRRFVKQTGAGYVYLGPRHGERFEAGLRRLGLGVTRFDLRVERSQLELFGGF